jgi:hypothetical protein
MLKKNFYPNFLKAYALSLTENKQLAYNCALTLFSMPPNCSQRGMEGENIK